jgi:choline dehydrogenase-like flavoprotein
MGYDVIVAGGGSAGCVAAARLSTDERCRVLLVVMPAIPAANTNLSTIAVAERIAQGLLAPLPRLRAARA